MNESGDLPVFPRLPQPRPPPGVSASLPGHITICPSPIPKDYHRPLPENYLPEPEAGTAADASALSKAGNTADVESTSVREPRQMPRRVWAEALGPCSYC